MRGRRPQSWPITLGWSLTCLLVCLHPADAYSAVATWDGGDSAWQATDVPTKTEADFEAEEAAKKAALIENLRAQLCALEGTTCPGGVSLTVQAGGLASISPEASGVAPLARVGVAWPLLRGVDSKGRALADRGPRVTVTADLTALPGEAVELSDPATFRAIEATLGIDQPLGGKIAAAIGLRAGFASRLATDTETPRDKAPRFGSVGMSFSGTGGDHLFVGIGGDQRLTGEWEAAVLVEGAVRLYTAESGVFQGGALSLIGRAILGLDFGAGAGADPGRPRRDSIAVGIAVGKP